MRSKWGDRTQFGVVSKTCAKQFFWNPNTAVRAVKDFDPDFLFVNKQFSMEVIEELVKTYPLAYFFGDFRNPLPNFVVKFVEMAKIGFFTWKKPSINDSWPKIKLVHQGANPEVYKPRQSIQKKYDVIFSGNFYGTDLRLKTARFLAHNFNFIAIGAGWPPGIPSLSRKMAGSMPRYYNQARITVGIFNRTDFSDSKVHYYTSNRLFNCMAMGIPHIAPYSPGVVEIFDKGYMEWRTHNDLGEKIEMLLKNPRHARNVGKSQREEILKRHTTLHAWLRMEKWIRKCLHSMK